MKTFLLKRKVKSLNKQFEKINTRKTIYSSDLISIKNGVDRIGTMDLDNLNKQDIDFIKLVAKNIKSYAFKTYAEENKVETSLMISIAVVIITSIVSFVLGTERRFYELESLILMTSGTLLGMGIFALRDLEEIKKILKKKSK